MYAKINGGTVVKFPYTFGDLRKEHPNVSFPRNIPVEIMRRYGMHPVTTEAMPDYNSLTQKVVTATTPTRNVVRLMTEEDAIYPITEEVNTDLIGTPVYGNDWVLTRTVVDMTAEEIAANDALMAESNRKKRNNLIAETDYFALTDVTMDAAMTSYRQALRDVTDHVQWPHLGEDDWPVKP